MWGIVHLVGFPLILPGGGRGGICVGTIFDLYFLKQVEVQSFSSVVWMWDLEPSSVEAGRDSVFCD
jgi:hypothetical protein